MNLLRDIRHGLRLLTRHRGFTAAVLTVVALGIGEEAAALRERTDLFEAVALANDSEGNLTLPDAMHAVAAASLTDDFLSTLGVAPFLGRSVDRSDIGSPWITGVDIG